MSSSWLDEHLETFVKPNLGFIPNVAADNPYKTTWTPKMIKMLRAMWETAKKQSEGRPILLAGRDVWEFEILARIEDTPTTFRPDISGPVARMIPRIVKEDYSEYFLLDTGYSGSVPKGLGIKNFRLIAVSPGSSGPAIESERQVHQLFPRAKHYVYGKVGYQHSGQIYGLAVTLEGAPKYWTRAFVTCKKISQSLSDSDMFTRAAQVTQLIANAVQPPKPRVYQRTMIRGVNGWRTL